MLKKIMRKTLSVILSIMMLLTTCSVATSLVAEAAVSTASGASTSDVLFVVPEAIYLTPTWNAYYQSVRMSFQFYVNNTVNSSGAISLENGEKTTGKMYFRYPNTSNANITFTWVDASGTELQGGTIKFGDSTARAAGTAYVSGSNYNAINITAGESPLLSASTTGCYLRWSATFVDSTDGLSKTATAYTYVYKPYVAPVGVAQRTVNDRGTNHYGQNLSWISGVHGIIASTAGTNYPNTTVTSSGKGLLTLSSSASGGVPIGDLNAQFASTNSSVSRWYYEGMDNVGCGGWLNTNESSKPLPDKTFRYFANELTGHSTGDDVFHNLEYSPTAKLYADKSRYTNFNQIPNISTGLMVTDDEKSTGNGAWFVSTYTGTWMTDHNRDYFHSSSTAAGHWNNYRNTGTILGNVGNYNDTKDGAESEGVKFNGKWNQSFSASGNFAIGAGYYNHDSGSGTSGDCIFNIAELRMNVTVRDNSTVRTALQNALKKAATLQACFYDTNNSTWLNFTELYRAGYMAMTKIDGVFSATATINGSSKTYTSESSFVSDLNNAVTLLTGGTGRVSRTAAQKNVAIMQQDNGVYRVIDLTGGTASASKSFTTFNKVTLSADNITGFTFAGALATDKQETYSVGNTMSYPRFTTEAYGATIGTNGLITYNHATTTGTDNKGNIYYTYFYTPNPYTVHFDANGGTGTMSNQSFVYSISQNLLKNKFTRNGYSFIGWATSAGGDKVYDDQGSAVNLTSTSGATVTLYAKWEPNTYSITYDTAGGSLTGTVTYNYTIETAVKLPTAEKSGYTLTGWRANNGGNWGPILYTQVGTSVPAGKYGDISFTAVWDTISYYVAFNANGGEGNMTKQTFTYDQAQNLSANNFTRNGYTFLGWAYSDTATRPAFLDRDPVINLTDVAGKTIDLFAVWSADTYTIIYKEEGGTIRDTLGSYTSNYTIVDRIQLPVNIEKSGYTFTGWKASTNIGSWNTQTNYTGLLNSGMTGNVTLLAQWTTTGYTITYVSAGGSIASTSYTTNYNINSQITLPSVTRTGYKFQGWQANNIGNWGESVYSAGKLSSGMFGNVTLTAQWLGVSYYVSFNSNGGTSGVMRDQTMVYGQEKALTLNTFTRSGYVFLGWGDSNTDTVPDYLDGALVSNLSSTQGGIVTMYAVWSKESYTINYEVNGGTITTAGTTTYAVTDRATMPVATRRGYQLSGWTPTSNVGNWVAHDLYNGILAAGMYGNVTLSAQWTAVTYTITWEAAGGTLSGNYTTSYDVDTTIVLPTVNRLGFAFNGWQADEAWGNVIFTDTAPTGKLGNVTITALWIQRNYTIIFHAAGGTGEMADQVIQFDTATALTANAFSKVGYSFDGWTMTEGATTKDFSDKATVYNLSSSDGGKVNLYAVWAPVMFSIEYNLNGASGFHSNSSVYMDSSTALREMKNVDAVIDNHSVSFMGWAVSKTAADAGTVAYANAATFALNTSILSTLQVNWSGTRPVITLYAVWSNVEIQLELVEDSGIALDASRNILYGIDQNMTAADMDNFLQIQGNGHLEYEYNAYLGTGSTVKVINDYTGETEATYTIVLFGDLNGDGVINSADLTEAKSMTTGSSDSSYNTIFGYAADVNNDGNVNSADLTVFKSIITGSVALNQSTREQVAA